MLDALNFQKETYSANARQYYQYCSAIPCLSCTLESITIRRTLEIEESDERHINCVVSWDRYCLYYMLLTT